MLKRFATFILTAAVLLALSPAHAQQAGAYPNRPVSILVAFTPGGPSDVLARIIGKRLNEILHQPFIIENRAGAAGNIGTEAVIRSPADGYTFLVVVPSNPIADFLYDKLNFSFNRDTAPVSGISNGPLLISAVT